MQFKYSVYAFLFGHLSVVLEDLPLKKIVGSEPAGEFHNITWLFSVGELSNILAILFLCAI